MDIKSFYGYYYCFRLCNVNVIYQSLLVCATSFCSFELLVCYLLLLCFFRSTLYYSLYCTLIVVNFICFVYLDVSQNKYKFAVSEKSEVVYKPKSELSGKTRNYFNMALLRGFSSGCFLLERQVELMKKLVLNYCTAFWKSFSMLMDCLMVIMMMGSVLYCFLFGFYFILSLFVYLIWC